MKGIDISQWQGDIDLAPYRNGFVIVRGGFWTSVDPWAERNIQKCEELSIPWGLYWYSYALNEEQAACRHWLDAQRDLIRPKLIVCLGRIAAMAVIKPDFRITREHGQWFDIESARAMAIYHPSALLRDITKRPETFADLRSLRSEAKRVCERLYK